MYQSRLLVFLFFSTYVNFKAAVLLDKPLFVTTVPLRILYRVWKSAVLVPNSQVPCSTLLEMRASGSEPQTQSLSGTPSGNRKDDRKIDYLNSYWQDLHP